MYTAASIGRLRAQQIDQLLAACPQATPRDAAKSIFELGLRIQSETIILRIVLPPNFPMVAPQMMITTPYAKHSWLDNRGNVVGCSNLFAWNQSSNLGYVVSEVLNQFIANPPRVVKPPLSNASQPPPYLRNQTQQQPKRSSSVESESGESLALPPVPTEFKELEEMSVEKLKTLQNDQKAFDEFFKDLDIIKSPTDIRDDMRKSNTEQARKNLAFEDTLNILKRQINERKETAREKREEFDVVAKRQAKALERFQPSKLLAKLKEKATEADDASEDLSSEFLAGDIDASTFIKRYMDLRKLYHLRYSKSVQFATQLRRS